MYMMQPSDQNFQFFKSALASQDSINQINSNEQNQIEFLNNIKRNNLNYEQVLGLIPEVKNTQVRSLLILHLLCSKQFIDNLSGKSLLTYLNRKDTHEPARLNALVYQLDVRVLHQAIIEQLQAEAAVSILYAIPHFCRLTNVQVRQLINRHPFGQVVTHWIEHFSNMPNAHYMLAHLLQIAPTNVLTELANASDNQKHNLCKKMIENLSLFENHLDILQGPYEEDYLILAIQQYLHGHTDKAYVTYINQIANSLLDKNHAFTLPAVTMLLGLNGQADFKELNIRTAYLTNYNVRKNALAGNISIFYDMGQVNIRSMMEPVILQPTVHKVKKPITSRTKTEEFSIHATPEPIAENPLLNVLSERAREMQTFIYFLIHFKGDAKLINKAINDYLDFYDNEANNAPIQSLHYTCELIFKTEFNTEVQKCLYNALLHRPNLYDESILYFLFIYDATRLITHIGSQREEEKYQHIINITTTVLNRLDPINDKALVDIAKRAQWEAEQELSFKPANGFFSRIYNLIKRCWIYGWTGFFVPNMPLYVCPAFSEAPSENSIDADYTEIILPQNKRMETQSLLLLVKKIQSPYSIAALDEIVEALQLFALEQQTDQEIEIRRAVHDLFHQILYENNTNPILKPWVETKQHYFIANRCRLLECLLEKNMITEDELLFSSIDDESPILFQLKSEFRTPLPPVNKIEPVPPPAPPIQAPVPAPVPAAAPAPRRTRTKAKTSDIHQQGKSEQDEKQAVSAAVSSPTVTTPNTPSPNRTATDTSALMGQSSPLAPEAPIVDEIDKQVVEVLDNAYNALSDFGQKIAASGNSFFSQTKSFFSANMPTSIPLPAIPAVSSIQSFSSIRNMFGNADQGGGDDSSTFLLQ